MTSSIVTSRMGRCSCRRWGGATCRRTDPNSLSGFPRELLVAAEGLLSLLWPIAVGFFLLPRELRCYVSRDLSSAFDSDSPFAVVRVRKRSPWRI